MEEISTSLVAMFVVGAALVAAGFLFVLQALDEIIGRLEKK